jgi:outer membrane protein TolC
MLRLHLAAALSLAVLAGPASAQPVPAPRQPPVPPVAPVAPLAPLVPAAPVAPAAPAAPAASDATADFDRALDELLGRPGGLTAGVVATRAARASHPAERKDAEAAEAREKVREVQRAIMPRVDAEASYTRLSSIDPPQIAPGFSLPQFFNVFHLGGTVALPITDLFIKLPVLRDAAKDGVVAAELSARAARLDAAAEATVTYYEWIRAELQVAVTTQLVAQVEANLRQVQALADVKRAATADVLRIQARKAEIDLALARIRELAAIRELQLRLAIGAGDDEPLAIGEDVRVAPAGEELPANPQLVAEARGRRLEGKALAAASHAIERALAGSKVGALPRVDVFGQASYDNPNQRIFPQDDSFKLTWAAGVQVSWSLNDYLAVDPQVNQARARIRALAADQAQFELGVQAQVESARSSFELAARTLAATGEGLAAAEEGYRVRQELFANERATATEVVDAQTALIQARFAAIDALIDRRIAWTRLRHAAGLDLT